MNKMPEGLVQQSAELSKEMQKACEPRVAVPFLALCIMAAINKLQTGEAEDQKLAERWLRQMWDAVDLAFIAPVLQHGQRKIEPGNPMTLAAYTALEGYFSSYGNLPKAIKDLGEHVQKETGFTCPKETLETFGLRLSHIVKEAMRAGGKWA